MSKNLDPILDCQITPGILAIIVVVVVISVVLAYLIGTTCVRAWDKRSPKYMYCSRCNHLLGARNVSLPPHLVPSLQGNMYNNPNPYISQNTSHLPPCNLSCLPDVRVDVADHNNEMPPTGTFQRLGMRTSRSDRSSKFENLETHALSPIQASPPDKISANSGMEVLTPSPFPAEKAPKYVNHPGALPRSKATQRLHLNYDPSRRNMTGKAGSIVTMDHTEGDQETVFKTGPDSVFYEDGQVEGDCRPLRELSKLSQVRILASPPFTGKHPDGLISKTPANANKSLRHGESKSCQPHIRSSLRKQDLARDSVHSEGSRKSRRSLLSRKLRLGNQDRKPRNSKDTQYSPLINENPTNTEDSCAISEEVQPLKTHDMKPTNETTQKAGSAVELAIKQTKLDQQNSSEMIGQDVSFAKDIEKGVGLLLDIGAGVINLGFKQSREEIDENQVAAVLLMENNNICSDSNKKRKRGSPGNTGNEISLPIHLIDIDIDDPQPFEPNSNPMASRFYNNKPNCDSCQLGTCRSHEDNNVDKVKEDFDNIQNKLSIDGHVANSSPHPGQGLGTKLKVRTSSSARKQKAKYLGKRPGFTESDITSQSEDERPGSRLSSLRRNHLAGMTQSEDDDITDQNQRFNALTSESPSQNLHSSVLTHHNGSISQRNDAPNKSSFPSTQSNQQFVHKDVPNFPSSSWDPMINNQQFENQLTNRPLNLSASSGQVNLSNSGPHLNLSVTGMPGMDNSTPAEGNHTSSPHSSAHLSVFNPVDLSIPGFNQSLQLSPNQDKLVADEGKLPSFIETSPPLQQDARYSHPFNNTMKPPLSSIHVETPSSYPDGSNHVDIHHSLHSGVVNPSIQITNSASPHETQWQGKTFKNPDTTAVTVSSENRVFNFNQDSSRTSKDTSRGVSMDSNSTLVPSPSPRNLSKIILPRTSNASQASPSPRQREVRSMPPAPQWSRVTDHAPPPSLPPPLPKTRIVGFGTHCYLPKDSSQHTPGERGDVAGGHDLVKVPEESESSVDRPSNRGASVTGLPISSDTSVQAELGEGGFDQVSDLPVRYLIPQPTKSLSVGGATKQESNQFRARSNTDSSHPASLAWDSYDSEPTFVQEKEAQLGAAMDDYFLATTSESEGEYIEPNMAYRSDGDYRHNRENVVARNEEHSKSDAENLKQQYQSSYVQSGVRTRSQSLGQEHM